jgi:urease accessory protein UreE
MQETDKMVRVVVANSDWMQLFPYTITQNSAVTVSDHYLIVVMCDNLGNRHVKKGFRFENMWLIEPEFSDGDLNTRFFHAAAIARIARYIL